MLNIQYGYTNIYLYDYIALYIYIYSYSYGYTICYSYIYIYISYGIVVWPNHILQLSPVCLGHFPSTASLDLHRIGGGQLLSQAPGLAGKAVDLVTKVVSEWITQSSQCLMHIPIYKYILCTINLSIYIYIYSGIMYI